VVVVACVVVVVGFFTFVDGGVLVATVVGAGVAGDTSLVLVVRRRVVGVVCGATVCGDTVAGGGDVGCVVAGGSVGCGCVGGGVVGASVGHGTVLPSPSTHVCACANGIDVSAITPVAASAAPSATAVTPRRTRRPTCQPPLSRPYETRRRVLPIAHPPTRRLGCRDASAGAPRSPAR
jgi:hypothetical protein